MSIAISGTSPHFDQGGLVQMVVDSDLVEQTFTTGFPIDDTTPQYAEGDELLSVSITPKNASSLLLVWFYVDMRGADGANAAALFKNTDTNAIFATHVSGGVPATGTFTVSAGSTTARTYSVRVGDVSAAAIHINKGNATTAKFGAAPGSYLWVMEIMP